MADLTKRKNDAILAARAAAGLDGSNLTYKQIVDYIKNPKTAITGGITNPDDLNEKPSYQYWTPYGNFQGDIDTYGVWQDQGLANTENKNKWLFYEPDGKIHEKWFPNVRDGGFLSKNFENIVKTGIGLMAGGAAGAGAGAGGAGVLEAGATMFPGEVAGFSYGGLGSTGAGLGLTEAATMFPGEAAGFSYAPAAEAAGSGVLSNVASAGKNAFSGLLEGAKDIAGSKLLPIGASLISGYLGDKAADKAGDAQKSAADAAMSEQRRQFDLTRGDLATYRNRGVQATNKLGMMMGFEPDQATYKGDFANYKQDPSFNAGYVKPQTYAPSAASNALAQYVKPRY